MNEFAVASEGVTDFAVLKNILIGFFADQDEPFLKPYQPDPTAEGQSSWQTFGNWENVLRFLREKKHRDALEFADFLIIQVDTDQSAHPNFGVADNDAGQPLDAAAMVARVKDKLREIIGPEDCTFYEQRLIFAICVREVECWLLPLWDRERADKTTGCLAALNRALSRQDQYGINPEKKAPRHYETLSKGYRKRRALFEEGAKNPSLKVFLDDLESRQITLG